MPRATEAELAQVLAEAAGQVSVGAEYFHYKHPDRRYIVRALVIIEETEEVGVVYEAQYGEKLTWLRPLSNWCEEIDLEGSTVRRFQKT